jgi:dTDP-4-amino-4,6-dideoxygalactose transaminase
LKVPFFRLRLTSVEEQEVAKVLKSGWITTGPAAQKFEEKVKNLSGAKHAVAVSSGTAGLHLALTALGIGRGDEVITTPYTMVATIEAILYTGAKPVFVDIDPETLNINPALIEKKITFRTKAILPVDIAGYPCDYDAIMKISRKHKLPIITDAAHSLGAVFQGKPIGSISDLTVFSFYSTKNITTGEGGMVVTNSHRLADKVRHLSLHGMTSSGWKRYSGGGWRYDITELGFKYNLPDLSAALGLGQVRRFPDLQQRRMEIALQYILGLKDHLDYFELPYFGRESSHAWHLFIIKLNPKRWKIGRDRLIEELEKEGIGCGVHFIPIYKFTHFQKTLRLNQSAFPQTENEFTRVISLPFYPDLKDREIRYVCHVLAQVAKKFGR